MKNWAGNITFNGENIVAPTSLSHAQELIAGATKVRALGSRHSFTRISDAPTIIDTRQLPEFLEFSADRTSVRVNASMTYGRLAELISPLGLALTNFASLPHISIAGAIATGTHGSGDANKNLASAVSALQMVTGTGELVDFSRGDEAFGGAVVSLGALGLVTSVSIDVVPAFQVSQTVYNDLPIGSMIENFDAVFAAGYSVSGFTRWRDIEQLWVKSRIDEPMPGASAAVLEALAKATDKQHPLRELDPEACTDQLGVPGAAVDRLPHFKLDFTPSAGDEIQSEFFVDRRYAAEAIEALAAIEGKIKDAMMVSELRTVAGDTQWMSPHTGRDSMAMHFTWVPDQAAADAAAQDVANALTGLDARAHWGKVFDPSQFDMSSYVDRPRFLQLVESLDPNRTFTNEWFEEYVG